MVAVTHKVATIQIVTQNFIVCSALQPCCFQSSLKYVTRNGKNPRQFSAVSAVITASSWSRKVVTFVALLAVVKLIRSNKLKSSEKL